MSYSIDFETNAFKNEAQTPKDWIFSIFDENRIYVAEEINFDWGCLISVEHGNQKYVVTLIAYKDNVYEDVIVAVDKDRTLLQRIMLRNKMTETDQLVTLIYRRAKNIARESDIRVIYVA